MTEDEFVEEYSGAPYCTDDVAEIILSSMPKDSDLYTLAQAYMSSRDLLEGELYSIGFEFG